MENKEMFTEETVNKNLINCKVCGEQISKKAKKCPKCGEDQRGFFARHKIITGILIFIGLGIIGNLLGDTESTTDTVIESSSVTSTEKSEDIKVEDNVPREFKSALKKAKVYSETMSMSKEGIYDQLVSEYGEGFPEDAARYGADNVQADWNANALEKAKIYADTMDMSDSSIYDQLVSEYGEKFTPEQAQYAIDNLN